jgi:hypothetical protein
LTAYLAKQGASRIKTCRTRNGSGRPRDIAKVALDIIFRQNSKYSMITDGNLIEKTEFVKK